ncbi:MAG: nuclear transport factor 2 family protein [Salinisphaera sp.]|nr:nuclear transport factor 2 family protein [Salinisphaera sp.]
MNLEWSKRWFGHVNDGDLDSFLKAYAPDMKFTDVPMDVHADNPEGVRAFLAPFTDPAVGGEHKFYPDNYIGDATGGVMEWAWEGTMGEADLLQLGRSVAGETFKLRGASVLRFNADGQVTEHRDYWDLATMLRSVGAM